jgi:hypothetical protein
MVWVPWTDVIADERFEQAGEKRPKVAVSPTKCGIFTTLAGCAETVSYLLAVLETLIRGTGSSF